MYTGTSSHQSRSGDLTVSDRRTRPPSRCPPSTWGVPWTAWWGAPTLGCVKGSTDYRMAKRALVRQVTDGSVRLADVCDAHPELLRAARNIGTSADRDCPICALADERAEVPTDEAHTLRLVTYVFGEALRKRSGTVVWNREELDGLAARHRSLTAYTVECCLVCGWNHLVESYPIGQAHAG